MSGVSQVNGTILFTCEWRGPNNNGKFFSQGSLHTKLVRLNFQNAKTRISIQIPQNISPSTPQRLSFTCRHPNNEETYPDTLSVTIEKMRGLKIQACIDEVAQRGPTIRSEREIPLQSPNNFEAGQTYHLVLSSDDFSLSATLIKLDHHALKKAKDELNDLLFSLLSQQMGIAIFEFALICPQVPEHDPSVAVNNVGLCAIQNEIDKIDPNSLESSMEIIRFLQRSGNEMALKQECLKMVGSQGIVNIFARTLEGLILGNIPPEVKKLVNEISKRRNEAVHQNVDGFEPTKTYMKSFD